MQYGGSPPFEKSINYREIIDFSNDLKLSQPNFQYDARRIASIQLSVALPCNNKFQKRNIAGLLSVHFYQHKSCLHHRIKHSINLALFSVYPNVTEYCF